MDLNKLRKPIFKRQIVGNFKSKLQDGQWDFNIWLFKHWLVVLCVFAIPMIAGSFSISTEATLKDSIGSAENKKLDILARNETGLRSNATLFTLCRNSDLFEILETIQNVEDRFNHKFHYDWVFLNDKPFSSEFVQKVSNLVSGNVYFDTIPVQYWSYPDHVDQEMAAQLRELLHSRGVQYGNSESYRHMCRFQSGFFYNTSYMNNYKYYWRIEPGVKFYCDISYDVFRYMEDHDKDYGFVMSIFEYKDTTTGLWEFVKEWLIENENLDKIHSNSLLEFIIGSPNHLAANDPDFKFQDLFLPENKQNLINIVENSQYNLCHYWNNFEIANMDFFRLHTYQLFFNFIDATGGFFYSRYGDAVIHSIAALLFLDRNKIHWFNDISYYHAPYQLCPLNDNLYLKNRCTCNQILDFTFDDYSCTGFWLQLMDQQQAFFDYELKKQQYGDDFRLQKYDLLNGLYYQS